MSAVLDCLQAAGIQTQENSMTADAAVIWSVLWHGRMKPNQQVYEHYRKQGKPVVVIEVGALYRGDTWKIAVNNVNSQGYYGHLENLDWDRPRKLQISLAAQHIAKPQIVIAMQHTRSLQVAGISDMGEWLKQTISILRNNTDRPIVVRPHPRCRTIMPVLPPDVTIEQPRQIANTYDSFDMHYDCHAVVNYNSGPGIQAAIAGVRPVVDFTSLAYPVGVGFADIEQPYNKDRDLWFTQICHTEYTLDELRRGIWLKNRARTDGIIDCACVIHGTGYDWQYVEKLYNMLVRMIPNGIRFHVYTEHDRSVPPHMIKHILDDWGVSGPKKSWWYKMQLFNPEHFSGNMLYFDLDVVVIRDLSWISSLPTEYFWTIRDFRYLQNYRCSTINSSAMWFNVEKFSWVWDEFQKSNVLDNIKRFPGDQDFLNHVLNVNQRRFFEDRLFQSYRWQCQDGGYDFQQRKHRQPGTGMQVGSDTSVVVFHGNPKPHQVSDSIVRDFWK